MRRNTSVKRNNFIYPLPNWDHLLKSILAQQYLEVDQGDRFLPDESLLSYAKMRLKLINVARIRVELNIFKVYVYLSACP